MSRYTPPLYKRARKDINESRKMRKKVEELIHLNFIMDSNCPIIIKDDKAHKFLVDFIMLCNKNILKEINRLEEIESIYNIHHLKMK